MQRPLMEPIERDVKHFLRPRLFDVTISHHQIEWMQNVLLRSTTLRFSCKELLTDCPHAPDELPITGGHESVACMISVSVRKGMNVESSYEPTPRRSKTSLLFFYMTFFIVWTPPTV